MSKKHLEKLVRECMKTGIFCKYSKEDKRHYCELSLFNNIDCPYIRNEYVTISLQTEVGISHLRYRTCVRPIYMQ